MKSEHRLEMYGEIKEDVGMKTHLNGPVDYAKKPKLQFRVGNLDLPDRRKRCGSNSEEEGEDRHAHVANQRSV